MMKTRKSSSLRTEASAATKAKSVTACMENQDCTSEAASDLKATQRMEEQLKAQLTNWDRRAAAV